MFSSNLEKPEGGERISSMTLTITKPRKHKTWLLPYLHGKTSQVTFFCETNHNRTKRE